MTTKSKPPKSVAMILGQVAGNLEFLQACERNMPKGKRIVAVRADSAAYQAAIFNRCEVTGKLFAIGADQDLLVAGFSNRGDVSASSCNSEPFTAAARPRLKSHFVGGRNGGKSAAARDSDAIELRAVPAICLAPSYRWAAGPTTETDLACDLLGCSVIVASVVTIKPAIDAASWRVVRTTLIGSIMPSLTRSPYSPVCAS